MTTIAKGNYYNLYYYNSILNLLQLIQNRIKLRLLEYNGSMIMV